MLKKGFPPVATSGTRIFILGSLPGADSLKRGQYYAHHGNQFWKLIGSAAGRDLHSLNYQARLAALADLGVGLWDVIDAADREGSLDASIKNPKHNAIGGLRQDYPRLEAIAFNGGRAAKDGRRLLSEVKGIELYDLISSSGAAARPFEQKAALWNVIARHLN